MLKQGAVRLRAFAGPMQDDMGRRTLRWPVAVASIFVASLSMFAWLNHDLFEAHRVAGAFMATLEGSSAVGKPPLPCHGSGVVPAAFHGRATGTVDWDIGFRAVRTRDGRERLSRQGFLRDAGSGQERWFKLTLQRKGDEPWCVLAFSIDEPAP